MLLLLVNYLLLNYFIKNVFKFRKKKENAEKVEKSLNVNQRRKKIFDTLSFTYEFCNFFKV